MVANHILSEQFLNPSVQAVNSWQQIHDLLLAEQYVAALAEIRQLRQMAQRTNDVKQLGLLDVAQTMCEACAQYQKEMAAYYESQQLTSKRKQQTQKKLLTFLAAAADTAVSDPYANKGTLNKQPSLWQRLHHMLHPPATEAMAAAVETETVAQTAVSAPTDSTPPAATAPQTSTPATPTLSIHCLGIFQLFEDDQLIENWKGGKGKSIFKYLVAQHPQPISKEMLMAEFWPEADADAARNNLNVAIYGLRQSLRAAYPDFSHILYEDNCYRLNPEMQIWIDVDAFTEAVAAGQVAQKQGDVKTAVLHWHRAEALYQDCYMADDRYDGWLMPQRQTLQEQYIEIVSNLSDYYYQCQAYTAALELCQKILSVEPCQESVHRRIMTLYMLLDQKHLALRQYHQCVAWLKDELEVVPETRTTTLYDEIRQGKRPFYPN